MAHELELEPRHRQVEEIAQALAAKDAAIEAIRHKAKTVASGYKAQMDELKDELDRLRAEYSAAAAARGVAS